MQTTEDSDSNLQKIKKIVGFKRAILVAIFLITGVCFASITPAGENIENTNRDEESDYTVAVPVTSPLFVSNNTYYDVDNNVESGIKNDYSINESDDNIDIMVKKIITCESNGEMKWGDLSLDYPVYGVAQFQLRTFNMMKEKSGNSNLDYYREQDQIWLLRWALLNGLGYHWTCYKTLGYGI